MLVLALVFIFNLHVNKHVVHETVCTSVINDL